MAKCKKLLALLLTLATLLSMVPVTALAAETEVVPAEVVETEEEALPGEESAQPEKTAEEETPVEEEFPAETEEPAQEEVPAEVEEPVEEEVPAEVEEPAQEEAPGEEQVQPAVLEDEPMAASVVDSGTCGDDLTWTLDDTGTLTISGTGAMEDYEWNNWSPWEGTITTVVITDGVTSIGNWAFFDHVNLISIDIPDSVTRIGSAAFAHCESLVRVTIPDSVTNIAEFTFHRCASLHSVTIPERVTDIGSHAFSGCASLTDIIFQGDAPSFSVNCFEEGQEIHGWYFYPAVTATAYVPADNATWDDFLAHPDNHQYGGTIAWRPSDKFKCGDNLYGTLVDGILTITGTGEMWDFDTDRNENSGDEAPWYSVRKDIVSVVIEEGATTIGQVAFVDSPALKSVQLPSTLRTIGNYAFDSCVALSDILLPGSLTEIGDGAFQSCQSLKELIIPGKISRIGTIAFSGCTALTHLTFAYNCPEFGDNVFYQDKIEMSIPLLYGDWEEICRNPLEHQYGGTIKWWGFTPSFDGWGFAHPIVDCIDESLFYRVIYKNDKGIQKYNEVKENAQNGLCLGVAASAMMTYLGIPCISDWNSEAEWAWDVPLESSYDGDSLLDYMQLLYVYQYTTEYEAEINAHKDDYQGIIDATERFFRTGEDPILIHLDGGKYEHALLPYRVEYEEDCVKIFVYDCNSPQQTYLNPDARYIQLNLKEYSWEYKFSRTDVWKSTTFLSCISYISDIDKMYSPFRTNINDCTISLCANTVTYNGKAQTPAVTVKDGSKTLAEGTDYTVAYSNNVNVGTATVTVTGTGNYTGTLTKTFSILLATPTLTSVSNVNGGIQVKWNAVTGAAKYRVFCKTGSGGWRQVGDTTGTSLTTKISADKTALKSGTTYTFTVRCITASGAYASDYNKTGKTIKYLATPALTSAKNTTGGITVTWSKVTAAASYDLYYKVQGGTANWTKLKTGLTGTSCTLGGGTSGKTYIYTVRAVSGSTMSYYVTSGISVIKLSTPAVTLKNASGGVTVAWDKIGGASGYYVYRKSATSGYTRIATVKGGSTVSYADTAVKSTNGTAYRYAVRAYNGSTLSAYVDKGIVRLTTPTLSSVTNSASSSMTVKWTKNTAATGYQVYYKTGSTGKTVTVSGSANLSKVISGLTKGSTYAVCVRSYKTLAGTNYYSGWSSAKSVKISK